MCCYDLNHWFSNFVPWSWGALGPSQHRTQSEGQKWERPLPMSVSILPALNVCDFSYWGKGSLIVRTGTLVLDRSILLLINNI